MSGEGIDHGVIAETGALQLATDPIACPDRLVSRPFPVRGRLDFEFEIAASCSSCVQSRSDRRTRATTNVVR